MMENIILETKKLCKSFSNGGIQQHVLKNVDLQIGKGGFTVLMGRSGSGKSTLLYALSGMDRPTVGEVYLKNQNIAQMTNDQLALIRRSGCGFVFQSIYLLDHMNVLDNVLTGGLLLSKDKKQTLSRARMLLTSMGLEEADFKKYPNQLSGGEKQRAAIARALINNPEILFADEPTGALNSSASQQVLNLFTQLNQQGQTILAVTHDLKTALRGNRILYIRDGAICGELVLTPFQGEEDLERKNRLQQFLGEMGW